MSSTVSLIGITVTTVNRLLPDGKSIFQTLLPHVVEWQEEVGYNSLRDQLGWVSKEESHIEAVPDLVNEQGLERYRVSSPLGFAGELEREAEYWDCLTNREAVITALRTHPEYTWWFHVG